MRILSTPLFEWCATVLPVFGGWFGSMIGVFIRDYVPKLAPMFGFRGR